MSSKENEDIQIETTKEVINLDDLQNNQEDLYDPFQKEMFENMEESDLQFQEEIEKLEVPEDTVIITEEKTKKKTFKEKLQDLKKKWQNMPKKKKIIIIISSLVILILIIVGLVFLFSKKEQKVEPTVPQVIVEEDNYRYEDGVLHFLNDDEELGTYECENKDEDLCYVAYLTNNDDFDQLRKVDENNEPLSIRSKIYGKRYVFVFDNKSEDDTFVKLYDMKENKVVEQYQNVKAYDYNNKEDVVILTNMKNEAGLVELTSDIDEIIPFKYDYLGIFEDDVDFSKIVAEKDNNYYLINQNNEVLTKPYSSYIVGATKEYVKTKDETGNYRVLNYQGLEIGSGDYALLLDGYVLFVRENKLYVSDYEKNQMNIEGIELYNDTYNPIAVYIDNKLDTLTKSFEAEIYDKTVTLKIYKGEDDYDTKTLDLQEGIFSKTLEFLNYFAGKLYIYKDATKKELLGQYECQNGNAINKDTKELTNCMIAKESFYGETNGNTKEIDSSNSLGLIPIFNERFVFIKDGDNISLYDLKENSTKATYKSVDTRSYTASNQITFVNTSNVYYIGESGRSGLYGLAKITPNTVEVQIEFDNKSIKRLGDYYVLEKDDGYYLSDLGGGMLTIAKHSPIVDYQGSYVKTFSDNKYGVSSFKDEESGEKFDYIELFNDYYATVNDKKLSIYKYNDEEPKVSNIELELDNYTNEEPRAFKLTFDGSFVVIEIGKQDNTYSKVKEIDLAKVQTSSAKDNSDNSEQDKDNEDKKDDEKTDNTQAGDEN